LDARARDIFIDADECDRCKMPLLDVVFLLIATLAHTNGYYMCGCIVAALWRQLLNDWGWHVAAE
jgi:hypothetical protein